MKASYKIATGRMIFELTGDNAKEIFDQVVEVQSIFEVATKCGLCESVDLQYRKRPAKRGDRVIGNYYEIQCGCGARFSFGQHLPEAGGSLFPKIFKDGQRLPNGGWAKYDPNRQDEEPWSDQAPDPAPPPPAPRPPQPQPQGQRQASRPVPPSPTSQRPPAPQPHPMGAGQRHDARDLEYVPDDQVPPPPRRIRG